MAHAEQFHQAYIQIQCRALDQITKLEVSFSTMKLWYERSKQRKLLAELPNELLQDIGLTRQEALAESQKPFWQK